MMILQIDTQDQNRVKVSLKNNNVKLESFIEKNVLGSQVLLPLIEKLLLSLNLKFKDLAKIQVKTGPGSFTGLRVGVSTANALGFSLGIPVNGKKNETKLIY